MKWEDLHKLCSTVSHISKRNTQSQLVKTSPQQVISPASYSLALQASWLFDLPLSEIHPQRKEISNSTFVIRINIPSLCFITFMVIYKENFLHLEIYSLTFFCWQGILFLSFSMFQLLRIKVFNSSKQTLFFLLLFYSWKQSNILQLHIWWVHLVSCFKYHSGS